MYCECRLLINTEAPPLNSPFAQTQLLPRLSIRSDQLCIWSPGSPAAILLTFVVLRSGSRKSGNSTFGLVL